MVTKKRFSMKKLGRDKIEEFFESQGVIPHVRTLDKDELIAALKQKLLEESQEVFCSTDFENLIEELADVREVILTLMHLSGISEKLVEEKRRIKKSQFGGFETGKYFHYIDIPLESPEMNYFLEKPEKYPEIELAEQP